MSTREPTNRTEEIPDPVQPSERKFRVRRGDRLELTFAVPTGKGLDLLARSEERDQEVTVGVFSLDENVERRLDEFKGTVGKTDQKVFDEPGPLPGQEQDPASRFRVKIQVSGRPEAPDDPEVEITLRIFVPRPTGPPRPRPGV